MRQIGVNVAQLAYGKNVHKDAAGVLNECRWRCVERLERLGIQDARARELITRTEARFVAMAHLCESPIEQMMLAAMSYMVIDGAECFPPAIHDVMSGEPWPNCPVVIVPQFVIARFRLDFLVTVDMPSSRYSFAVECDGAEHHDDPSDRMRDSERDAYLRCLGIKTVRRSGKWIYKHQWRIADEIEAIIQEKRDAA